jgi:hypothetical protein
MKMTDETESDDLTKVANKTKVPVRFGQNKDENALKSLLVTLNDEEKIKLQATWTQYGKNVLKNRHFL